jgi:hypothetical protein
MPAVLGLALLIGGLIALLRIHRRDKDALQKPKSRAKEVAIGCLAVGGVVVLASLSNLVQSISSEPERTIVIAERAGGVPRVELSAEVVAALEQRRGAAAKEGIELRYGGYAHPYGGDAPLLFMGLEQQNSDPERSIKDFFAGIAASSGEQPRLTEYPAGELGGEVRCAAGTELRCAWADRSTYGAVTATDIREADLAELLVKMRTDLEQKK